MRECSRERLGWQQREPTIELRVMSHGGTPACHAGGESHGGFNSRHPLKYLIVNNSPVKVWTIMQKKILNGTPLQDWVNEQICGDEMLWKGAFGTQIEFIRDELTPLVESGMNFYERKDEQIARVISTHTSKSITLPVVQITRQDFSISFTVRNNFFGWKLTVLSEEPIKADFGPLFKTIPPPEPDYTGDELRSVYFEGFPENLVCGYHSQNKRQWSASIGGDFALWTVVFLCMQSIGALSDKKYHTRRSHQKEMEAEKAARERYESVKKDQNS